MGDAGEPVPPLLAHRASRQHELEHRRRGEIEVLGRTLGGDGRRERPEALAQLDDPVEPLLDVGDERIGEDRAVAERPRPVLHPALEPRDDLVRSQRARRVLRGVLRAAEVGPVEVILAAQGRQHLLLRIGRPVEGERLDDLRGPILAPLVEGGQRRPDGRAVIGGGGLHVDLVEDPVPGELAVEGAVQRDAACHAERPEPGRLAPVRDDMEQDPFQALLRSGGEVAMRLGEHLGPLGTRQQLLESGEDMAVIGRPLGREPVQVERVLAVRMEVDEALEEPPVDLGVPIRRQAHHLVLVGVELETEMPGDEPVEDADRVPDRVGVEDLEATVSHRIDGHRVDLAHAVAHDAERVGERRGEIRAGRVGEMVLDADEFSPRQVEAVTPELDLPDRAVHLRVERGADHADRRRMAAVVEAVRDHVDVPHADAGLVQAVLDGFLRERVGVLLGAEALLGGGGDDAPIGENRRGAVQALDDALLAGEQVGVAPRVTNRRVKPAVAENDHRVPLGACGRNSGEGAIGRRSARISMSRVLINEICDAPPCARKRMTFRMATA